MDGLWGHLLAILATVAAVVELGLVRRGFLRVLTTLKPP